jgi:hypothetical protein
MTSIKENKETTLNRIRQAIVGIQDNFPASKTILLEATPTKPADAIATLQAAIDAIDKAASAEAAFHAAVAAQHTAIAAANALLVNLEETVKVTLGRTPAILGGFGFSVTVKQAPTPAVKAAAVQKRAATRAARGTKGPRQKAAIKGTVPATPTTPVKPA